MTAACREMCTLLQHLNLLSFVSLFTSDPVNELLLSIFHGICPFVVLFI